MNIQNTSEARHRVPKQEDSPFCTLDNLPWGWRERAAEMASDRRGHKLDLSAGIVRDENGAAAPMAAVSAAERQIAAETASHVYLPPLGLQSYRDAMARFIFGPASEVLESRRSSTIQTIGGAGALRLASDCLCRLKLADGIHVSAESWADHRRIFERAGLAVKTYPYLSQSGTGVDCGKLLTHLFSLPPRSVVLLQACCHNPTGYDLPENVWGELLALAKSKNFLLLFDLAYPGLGKGLEADLLPVRMAAREPRLNFLVATSCCKSFSMYDGRLGALTAVLSSPELAERFESQVKVDIQASYSSPPRQAAAVVARVLNDPALRTQWEKELQALRASLKNRRSMLVERLERLGAPSQLLRMGEQTGLFGWTGLDREACKRLADDFGIYVPSNGRLCMGALPASRIKDVAFALLEVSHRRGLGETFGLVEQLVQQASAQMRPSPKEWVEGLDVRAYAVRQATSCTYLETLFPRIVSAAPEAMKARLSGLFSELVRCHRRQFDELSAVVTVPSIAERRSYYFDSMYSACDVPSVSAELRLDEGALLRLLSVHAVSYRRGLERYSWLRHHKIDENRALVPVWSRFFMDAPRNSRLVVACMLELFGEDRTRASLLEAARGEAPVMERIWAAGRPRLPGQ